MDDELGCGVLRLEWEERVSVGSREACCEEEAGYHGHLKHDGTHCQAIDKGGIG